MRKIVEDIVRFPPHFRPVHDVSKVNKWQGVPVFARGTAGVVRGGVINGGVTQLFVITQNWSAWLAPEEVEELVMSEAIKLDDIEADHSKEVVFPGEPEGGWETSPALLTQEIVTLMLCKFSGIRPEDGLVCEARANGRHANVNCLAYYHSAAGLRAGSVEVNDDLILFGQETTLVDDEPIT